MPRRRPRRRTATLAKARARRSRRATHLDGGRGCRVRPQGVLAQDSKQINVQLGDVSLTRFSHGNYGPEKSFIINLQDCEKSKEELSKIRSKAEQALKQSRYRLGETGDAIAKQTRVAAARADEYVRENGKTLLSANHRWEDSFYCKKIFQIRRNLFTAACMPLRQVFNGHWPQFAQQVEQSFQRFHFPPQQYIHR